MPRRLPPPELAPPAEPAAGSRPTAGLEDFAGWLLWYQRRHNLTPRRLFIVACTACGDEVYLISAGPRGGGWKGRCPTCRHPAGKEPKADVIREIDS